MKLDPNKPYSELFGDVPMIGARYEQGGKYFKPNGDPCTEESAPPEPEQPADLESMTKDDLLRYAQNVFNKKLDKRRTWDAILQQVKNLQPE